MRVSGTRTNAHPCTVYSRGISEVRKKICRSAARVRRTSILSRIRCFSIFITLIFSAHVSQAAVRVTLQSQPDIASLPSNASLIANTINITKGGTYSGDWVSTDPAIPAVTVLTDEPVILENSTVMGRGNLIVATGTTGANLTVRNVTGRGLDPLVPGKQRGSFVVAYIMNSLMVQNCTMTGTSFGVKAGFSNASSLSILNNLATDLEDRASDGNGSFLTVRPQLGHFALLYQVSAQNGAEIGWNQIMQTMGQSSIDDVITMYKSQGSANRPINVHDNYMEGYSSPAAAFYGASGFSTTGDSTSLVSAYILLHANQIVHTPGNGLSILNGHDILADGNRVVSCGQNNDGTWFSRAGVAAITLWDRSGAPSFYDNAVTNTGGGLVIPNTASRPVASNTVANPSNLLTPTNSVSGNSFTDPCLVNGTISLAAEDAERTAWSTKLIANAQMIGDQHSPVQITVNPANASLVPSQSQQFNANIMWANDTAATWAMSPAVGTISSSGLYTAPSSIVTPQTVTIIASSVADPSKTASAVVQLIAPVTVSVNPGVSTITSAQTQLFTANVSNTSNVNVAWSISPAIGSISAYGVYSPPPSLINQQAITITATSLADNTKYASTTLTVTPALITMAPSAVSLAASQTQQFNAVVQNAASNGVLWSISPAVGSMNSSGLYTAPSSISSVLTVTVTAANAANTMQWVTATITLLPPVKVNLLSNYAALTVTQTAQFTAFVQNSGNSAVTWSISRAVGSISAAGVYTAPATIAAQQTLTFTATSVADPTKSVSGCILLTPPVSIAVLPATAILSPSGTQTFAGNVAWAKNTNVSWSVSPALGTISSSGLYTAPSDTASPRQVSITATSAADPSQSSSAIVTLNPPVAVTVTPATATVTVGQTQLFTAATLYSTNGAVTWTVSPAIGSISASGRYTPPATALTASQNVMILATSVADPTKSAAVIMTINPPASVTVSPANVALVSSQTQQFNALLQYSGTGNTVTWSVSPATGSITISGLYTAPASITSVQTLTVTATLAGNLSKSASMLVTLLPPVKVNLTSSYATVTPSQTTQFTARVQNTSNIAVEWTIAPAFGSISTDGIYTAPSAATLQRTVTVTATSVADPTKSASGVVVVNPPVSVAVSPQAAALSPSASQQFTGNVAWSSNTAVTWTMSPAIGTLSSTGLYTAPANTITVQTVTITGTSNSDLTKSSSALVVLNPPPSVAVNPVSATVTLGQTQLFTADLAYTKNTAVTWSISPAIGTISASGRYTPSSTAVLVPQTITVTATSVADPTCSSSAMLTVNPPVALTVTPDAVYLAASQAQQFNATVQWTANNAVSWSISPATGTVSQTGLYTAPTVISSVQRVTLTAISLADTSKYVTSIITLLPPVKVNLVSSYIAISASQSTSITALVQNASDTRVTWTINPAFGTISPFGVYTAPATVPVQQAVTVTAASIADPTKTASGTVMVNPAITIAVVPGTVTLTSSHIQQFSANVAWSQNTMVTWSLSPMIGTLSNSGLYTAPDTITTNQTVFIKATSTADPSKTAAVPLTLMSMMGPAPITITEGGTYSGNWISSDPNIPAVSVTTDAAVVIQNSTVQGSGNLIQITGITGANVTVQNVTGAGIDSHIIGRVRGAFVRAALVNSLIVENCTMTGTAFGIQVSSSVASTLRIVRNKGVNLEDRASAGIAGLQATRPQLGHFVVLHNMITPNGAEIAWNQLQQTIGQSSTEDAINIYDSQGTSTNPIIVHDNYMEGYSSSTTPTYTGNGLISDGDSTNMSAYILFQANQMVHMAGGGVAIANGHDVTAVGNRVVSCGIDRAGQWYSRTGTVAIALWNFYGAPKFYNNIISQTTGGLVSPDSNGRPIKSDFFVNSADAIESSNSIAGNLFDDPCIVHGAIDSSAEDRERVFWANKLTASSILIGDQH